VSPNFVQFFPTLSQMIRQRFDIDCLSQLPPNNLSKSSCIPNDKKIISAMGPILPQLSVYGKELGISSVVMGTITGILPFAFLLAKPAFGLLVDIYRNYRKSIFMLLIVVMTVSYTVMNFIPSRELLKFELKNFSATLDTCNVTVSSLMWGSFCKK
jgi:MFS family permease